VNDDQLAESALNALQRGNAQRAQEHLFAVERPSGFVWYLRAVAAGMLGHEAEARTAIERGLSMEPNSPELLMLLAGQHEEDGAVSEAEAVYLALLNESPAYHPALISYARLLATAGDPVGATKVMDRVPGHVQAGDPDALHALGVIALSEGRLKDSQRLVDAGLELDPNSVRLHALQAAQASLDPKKSKSMVTHLSSAAAADPRQAAALGYEARFISHPLMAPVRLIDRIGAARLWIGWLVVLFGLPRIWPNAPMLWIALAYICFALYSWIAPPMLRRWLRRKGEL